MRVLIPTLIVVAVFIAVYLGLAIARSVRRAPWPHDSPLYRNHLGMARWIERQLDDDMVRVTIRRAEQTEARKLLDRFYGEPRELDRGDDE